MEELGIRAEEKDLSFAGTFHIKYANQFHGKLFNDNEVAFVYIYERPVDESKLVLQTKVVLLHKRSKMTKNGQK